MRVQVNHRQIAEGNLCKDSRSEGTAVWGTLCLAFRVCLCVALSSSPGREGSVALSVFLPGLGVACDPQAIGPPPVNCLSLSLSLSLSLALFGLSVNVPHTPQCRPPSNTDDSNDGRHSEEQNNKSGDSGHCHRPED